ncbi:TMEM165/GDT1 family protein [Nocardioides sp. cx-173]|uniref:TMEM165/GDT1 family protein n=1 Tax=Nocardioides sp. cx-173 TaxID=2898796 RepID=UPI001E2CABD1|nr:TMEM165/GDT1 family protein [Nocardioides sp. cx-173]MCD4523612.1 TMEM165/GDT1 family protein [Nocardioides sp. cx-173]UGB42052.1 TMEM165/GDT1 family protein [Nocardioides sp. cx-173]
MDLAAVALTFGAIFLVELPDKTFLATLVLATKYRPILVWVGVGLAFTVQTGVAVLLGHAASLLPPDVVRTAAVVLFLVGAVILFREGRSHQEADGEEFAEKAKPVHGWRAVLASFLVLFAAEWGDLSQLLTLSLVAKYEAPLSVFVGALGALLTVSALAVIVGRSLLRFVSIHVLHYLGATVCVALAALTIYELLS